MIVACLKWTAPPGGDVSDDRFAGVSAADQAALELALQLAARRGDEVTAITVGPAGAERALRDAVACGARHAIRVDIPTPTEAGPESRDVAFEIAQLVGAATIVVCGDYSLDRGSGSVPAFVAHHAGRAQALGLVGIDVELSAGESVSAIRRLDGGRREALTVPVPCVLSVEGSVASLRRAALRDALASRSAPVELRIAPPAHHRGAPRIVTPFRPRARVLAAPAGDDVLARLRALTDAGAASGRGEIVELEPRAAAERIVAALREWGYIT